MEEKEEEQKEEDDIDVNDDNKRIKQDAKAKKW